MEERQYYIIDDAPSNCSYDEVFPKLKRCLAVLVSSPWLLYTVFGIFSSRVIPLLCPPNPFINPFFCL